MRVLLRNGLRLLPVMLVLPFGLQCSNSVQPEASFNTPTYDYRQLSHSLAILDIGQASSFPRGDHHGDHLAVAHSDAVLIVDTQNALAPHIVHEIPRSTVRDIALTESHIYVAERTSIDVLDRQDPVAAPVGQLQIPGVEYIQKIFVDQACFVGARTQRDDVLYVIGVDDPANPVILSQVLFNTTIVDIARDGDLLMVGTYNGAVFLDVSDLSQVIQVSRLDHGPFVALRDGLAYVSGHGGYTQRGMEIYEIQDPTNPIEVGGSTAPFGFGPMVLQGDRLYMRISGQVEIFDVSDPRQPVALASVASPGWGWMFVRGDQVWSLGQKLMVHEISAVIDPPILGARDLAVWSYLGVDDDKFVGYEQGGVFVLGIGDPTLPTPHENLPGGSFQGCVDAGRIYTQQQSQEIEVREIASQRVVHLVDPTPYFLKPRDRVARIEARNPWLYVFVTDEIATRYELLVFELGAGGRHSLAGRLESQGDPQALLNSVAIETETIYVSASTGNGDGLLDVIDITDPYRPKRTSRTFVERLSSYGSNESLVHHKGYLYLDSLLGLMTVDVRHKEAPRIVSVNEDVQGLRDVAAKGRFLYVMRSTELLIMDLTLPGQPVTVASRGYSSTNPGVAVFATNTYLFTVRSRNVEALPFHAAQR